MTTELSTDPGEVLGQHLTALREYAHRVFAQGKTLAAQEEDDKANRMREFLAIGDSLKLTAREMVALVCRSAFVVSPGCGCSSCRARR